MFKNSVIILGLTIVLITGILCGAEETDEVFLYANLFKDSILFPSLERNDPEDMMAEMLCERKLVQDFGNNLSRETRDSVNNLVRTRDNELKAFYMMLLGLSKNKVSDDEIQTYYRKNTDQYRVPEFRSFWYLFISAYATPDKIDWKMAERDKTDAEILLELKNKPIEELARTFNESHYYGNKCRKVGPVRKGKFSDSMDEIIFSLEEGQETDFIKTPKGYIKIRLTEVTPSYIKPLEEVENDIRPRILYRKDQESMEKMKSDLLKKYNVDYEWKEWNREKSPEQVLEELQQMFSKLSIDEDVPTTYNLGMDFRDLAFHVVLLKEFQALPKEKKEGYEFLENILKTRHLAIEALESEAQKRSDREYSREELEEFYENHQGYFYQPGIIEARMATFEKGRPHRIQALDLKTARDVADHFYRRLQAGDEFEQLARNYGQGEYAEKGGYVGVVNESESRMGAIFDINAFQLKEGEYTKPLQRPGGGDYIIIQADKVIQEKKLLPLDEKLDLATSLIKRLEKNKIALELAEEYLEKAREAVPEVVKNRHQIPLHNITFYWM